MIVALWRFRKPVRALLAGWLGLGLNSFAMSEPPAVKAFWLAMLGLVASWLWLTKLERPYFMRADRVVHFRGLPAGRTVEVGAEVRDRRGVHARVLHRVQVNRKGKACALVELIGNGGQA